MPKLFYQLLVLSYSLLYPMRVGSFRASLICLYFQALRASLIAQFMTLSTRFNHHRFIFDFNATDMNPAVRGKDIPLLTNSKGVIIDDGQPMIRRTGNTSQNEGCQITDRILADGFFIRPGGSGKKWIPSFFWVRRNSENRTCHHHWCDWFGNRGRNRGRRRGRRHWQHHYQRR